MIVVSKPLLKAMVDAAEAAYPAECCGLLVGRSTAAGSVVVTAVEPSPNVAGERRRDRFEVDPRLRFELMRTLADGPERLVGHYHSHPDRPARPSRYDLEMACEPDLVWLITSVQSGRAVETTAHVIDPKLGEFRQIDLRTPDGEGRAPTGKPG